MLHWVRLRDRAAEKERVPTEYLEPVTRQVEFRARLPRGRRPKKSQKRRIELEMGEMYELEFLTTAWMRIGINFSMEY
jgi:hypothetical protein